MLRASSQNKIVLFTISLHSIPCSPNLAISPVFDTTPKLTKSYPIPSGQRSFSSLFVQFIVQLPPHDNVKLLHPLP